MSRIIAHLLTSQYYTLAPALRQSKVMGLNVAGQRKTNIICSLLTLNVSPCSFPPMILKPKASFAWDLVRTRLWICFTISHAISLVVISVGRALLIRQEDGMSERGSE